MEMESTLQPIEYVNIPKKSSEGNSTFFENYCRLCAKEHNHNLLKNIEQYHLKLPLADFLCINLEREDLPEKICNSCGKMITTICTFQELCSASQDSLNIISNNTNIESDQVSVLDKSQDEEDSIHSDSDAVPPNDVKTRRAVRSSFLKPGEWMCLDCGNIFSSCYKMKIHRKSCELIGTEKSKKNGPFECKICGKLLPTFIGYGVHKNMHYKTDNKAKSSMQISKKTKSQEKKICYICGKSFNNSSYSLNVHLQFHNKDKPFECEICQKRYYTNSDLKDHMQSHGEDRTFECDICEKKFFTRKIMRKHKIIHDENMRRIQCNYCPKKFIRPNQLTTHMLVHSGLKPHPCDLCEKKYKFSWDLKKHKEKNHNIGECNSASELRAINIDHEMRKNDTPPSNELANIDDQNNNEQIVFIFTTEAIENNNENVYFNIQT